jgi:hypothetical protein
VRNWFQAFAFKCSLYRYSADIPEESAVLAPALRAKVGARVAHLDVGRGKVAAVKVVADGTKLVAGRRFSWLSSELDPELESAWFQPLNPEM